MPIGKYMKNKITTLQEQNRLLDENWKRALADYQNLSKRIEADKKDFVRYATANIISELIPTLDILDMADKHSADPGVHMAVKQFHDVLENSGLQTISPAVGEEFNHQLHECVETLKGDPKNTIAELLSIGYKIDSFVIRPAKVKVYKDG
jgi:molecular chaperone GrpE